ncbi:Uncharacterised protein [Vibrio cholerae]|uniref:Uncharacterized protein n=1 Tax=Vibrio cholerae TaxID=666 RepID=A0A655NXY4_VIBCL|nr:Uncharacterised protein [Vibrio cholerae]
MSRQVALNKRLNHSMLLSNNFQPLAHTPNRSWKNTNRRYHSDIFGSYFVPTALPNTRFPPNTQVNPRNLHSSHCRPLKSLLGSG